MLNAVLIIDKPARLTSHDVVNRLRRITGERSVGHLGTLDPMATGVLPMVLGRYTRLAQFFSDARKTYEGEIRLGFATTTYDAEGDPVAPTGEPLPAGEAPSTIGPSTQTLPTLDQIRAQLPAFTGRILQRPPDFSAKKVKGVPAYKLARREKPVELAPVEVEVHRFELLSMEGDRVRFVAEVSAGTYIRSLAHDLGQVLGCGAHLASLRRTASGEFNITNAITIDELMAYTEELKQSLALARSNTNLSESSLSDVAYGVTTGEEVNGNVADSPFSSPAALSLKASPAPAAAIAQAPTPYLHPRRILTHMPSVTAAPDVVAAIRNGRPVNLPEYSDAPLVKVFASRDLLLAVAQRIAGTLFQPKVVLYSGNEPMPE